MPRYDYFCEANGRTIEATHPNNVMLKTWGEICYVAQIPLGDTDPLAPVQKLVSAPAVTIPTSNATLREKGFVKLVKRDQGVYENVTALDHEKRFFKSGDASSVPDLKSRIED